MKLKNKILLAASGLLVLSGAAATTGAFAWFTATRTATVAGTGYKVQSNTTDLSIDATLMADGKNEVTKDEGSTTSSVSFTSKDEKGYELTDVSGDGLTFVKANFDSNNTIIGYTALDAQKAAGAPYSYWIDITLTFTATGARQLGIFISDYAFSASTDGDIYKAGRVAFLDSTKKTLIGYAAPYGADVTPMYVKKTTSESETKTSYAETDVNTLNAEGKKVVHPGKSDTEKFTEVTDADFASVASKNFADNGYIGSTSAGTLSVVERIWLEGTDASCGGKTNGNTNLGKSFALDINFYGVALNA